MGPTKADKPRGTDMDSPVAVAQRHLGEQHLGEGHRRRRHTRKLDLTPANPGNVDSEWSGRLRIIGRSMRVSGRQSVSASRITCRMLAMYSSESEASAASSLFASSGADAPPAGERGDHPPQ
jgi:hypothetical protein